MNPTASLSKAPATCLPPLRVAWWVWGMGAPFYVIGFFHRVAPAVMTVELMADFSIGAGAMGNLSAFYFYSYVIMQIPTGILADTWGPRRLMSAGALVAGIGGLIFALAPTIGWAYLGRFLIGGSVAVAWIALLKLAANWFAPNMFALVSGVALFCGILGAVGAGLPLRLLMDMVSWRPTMMAVSAATLVAGFGIWRTVRDSPRARGYADFGHAGAAITRPPIGKGLIEVLRFRNAWLLMIIPGGFTGAIFAFGGLWGVPFLTTHYEIPTARASVLTSMLLVAYAAASPLFGWLSDRQGLRKPIYAGGGIVALAGWCLLIYLPHLPPWILVILLLTTGFASGSMILSFAFAKESVPAGLAGTITGMVNMGAMLGPMLLQPAVGWILDRCWTGELVEGVRHYDLTAYQAGFSLMTAWLAISLVLLMFTRETYCRQRPTTVPG